MNSINNLKAKYKIDNQKENIKRGNIKNKYNKKENKRIIPSNRGKFQNQIIIIKKLYYINVVLQNPNQ